jgi:hypothetical protein
MVILPTAVSVPPALYSYGIATTMDITTHVTFAIQALRPQQEQAGSRRNATAVTTTSQIVWNATTLEAFVLSARQTSTFSEEKMRTPLLNASLAMQIASSRWLTTFLEQVINRIKGGRDFGIFKGETDIKRKIDIQ